MRLTQNTNGNYTTRQLKLPLEIEKYCRTDIRYMYLLDDMKAPSFATLGNLLRSGLAVPVEQILADINAYIFETEQVDQEHVYIDGTKVEANANRYTWVWKKSCVKNRDKVFEKISQLIDQINKEVLGYHGVSFEKREIYAVDYVETLLLQYRQLTGLDVSRFVTGRGHRKTLHQRQYQELEGYLKRLKTYADHIQICGEERNSYAKTDHDATFMRIKRDYMGTTSVP